MLNGQGPCLELAGMVTGVSLPYNFLVTLLILICALFLISLFFFTFPQLPFPLVSTILSSVSMRYLFSFYYLVAFLHI